jgi:dihydrofolate reductase
MKLILACDPNGGIGYQNKLPWTNIRGDLPRFKRLTDGQNVIMGRNTWDSLPKKPLPGRLNFVVSSSELEAEHHNVIRVPDMEFNQPDDVEFWIIGGARLVETSWKNINEIHLTKVYDHYACDTFIDLLYIEHNYVRTYSEMFPDHTYEIWKKK